MPQQLEVTASTLRRRTKKIKRKRAEAPSDRSTVVHLRGVWTRVYSIGDGFPQWENYFQWFGKFQSFVVEDNRAASATIVAHTHVLCTNEHATKIW